LGISLLNHRVLDNLHRPRCDVRVHCFLGRLDLLTIHEIIFRILILLLDQIIFAIQGMQIFRLRGGRRVRMRLLHQGFMVVGIHHTTHGAHRLLA
jgi:hypothetical protein